MSAPCVSPSSVCIVRHTGSCGPSLNEKILSEFFLWFFISIYTILAVGEVVRSRYLDWLGFTYPVDDDGGRVGAGSKGI